MAEPPVDHNVAVELLKAEGNALHTKGQYKQAYQKYTEAIALDGNNAVLYANRAASSLALKEYLNAGSDANKAVSIKPDYAKAWARLGTASQALSLYDMSTNAWEHALKCLPESASECTPVELRLKDQCRKGLEAVFRDKAKAIEDGKSGKNVASIPYSVTANGDMPWQRALSMLNEMKNSSGWVILNAYRDFSKGLATMQATKITHDRIEGTADAIVDLTNGILRDPRVFFADSPEWFKRLKLQFDIEAKFHGAWLDCGPDEITKRALELQRRQGWEPVRRALSLTVRGSILRGFLVWFAQKEHVSTLEYYKNAITILEWGLHTWPNVSNSERGAIFHETFVRGIRRMYLEVYLSACKRFGPDSEYSLDTLADLATKLLEETHAHMPTGQEEWMQDVGFFLSFFIYPTAEAHASLGFVNMQKAMRSTDDVGRALDYFAASAEQYMKAAMLYPEDDENRIYYLRIAFEARWHRGDPLREVLPLCKLVQETNPKVEKIWEYSTLTPTRQAFVRGMQRFERDAQAKILEGTYTLETKSSKMGLEEVEEN